MEKQERGRKTAGGKRRTELLLLTVSMLLILTVLLLSACGAEQSREEPVLPAVTEAPSPEPTTFGGGLRGVAPLTSRVESRQIKIPDFLKK